MPNVEVIGGQEAGWWLRSFDERLDHWLVNLVGDAVEYGGQRLRAHAPGSIKELVGVNEPTMMEVGVVEGTAFVTPGLDEDTLSGGLGSDPADYPYYVDVGTGIFGEYGTPITTIPGHVMGPIEYGGRMIYVKSIAGQEAQHYFDAASRDVDARLPSQIRGSLHDLG